jgi:hypothetical protein
MIDKAKPVTLPKFLLLSSAAAHNIKEGHFFPLVLFSFSLSNNN